MDLQYGREASKKKSWWRCWESRSNWEREGEGREGEKAGPAEGVLESFHPPNLSGQEPGVWPINSSDLRYLHLHLDLPLDMHLKLQVGLRH